MRSACFTLKTITVKNMKTRVVSLNQNTVFKRLYYRGKSVSHSALVLYFMRNNREADVIRLGITVSKKLGKAVRRNRIRRLIREAFRVHEASVIPGYNIVIVARFACLEKSYAEFSRIVKLLLSKAKLVEK